ncbi:MAG: acyl-CoA dehydrogenase family protein [Nocardioidaceae bacterium]
MQIAYPPEAQDYREHVRAFLREHLPSGWRGLGGLDDSEYADFLPAWRTTLYDNGLLAPAWPREHGGGGLTPMERVVVAEEFARAGVPTGTPNDEFGIDMLGSLLLDHGTEEQRAYFLPRILSGEHVWCQGFSEPGAGSDLAAVRTRATMQDGRYILDGQKIWTSDGLPANWIFVLARTNPEAPKHRGLTFFLVPIDQPGVELRPIEMMTGHSDFCETFFTRAKADPAHVVGEVDGGWSVAMALLSYEREETAVALPLRYQRDLERLIDLARSRGKLDDPDVRRRLAWCQTQVQTMRWLGLRSVSQWLAGESDNAQASIFKLCWSEYHVAEGALAMDILGEEGMVTEGRRPRMPYYCDEPQAPNSTASWQGSYLIAQGGTIYAGTTEIQYNLLAERALGLPRA